MGNFRDCRFGLFRPGVDDFDAAVVEVVNVPGGDGRIVDAGDGGNHAVCHGDGMARGAPRGKNAGVGASSGTVEGEDAICIESCKHYF